MADFDFLLGRLDELRGKAKETCENAVAKRTELKSRSREIVKSIRELTVEQAKVEAELVQSKIDLNTNYGPWLLPHHIPSFDAKVASAVTETADREAKRKAVAAVVEAWEKSKRRVFMVYRDTDHLDVGRVIKAAGFDVQDWRDWVLIAANKPHLLGTSVPPRAQTAWDSFPKPRPKTIADFDCLLNKHFGYAPSTSWLYEKPLTAEEIERAVAEGNMKTVNFPTFPTGSSAFSQTTMKELAAMCDASADRLKYATVAQLQNPATLKALFDHLRNEGDRETLTALFRLSSAALTAIRFQEALGKTATGEPGDDKASEHF